MSKISVFGGSGFIGSEFCRTYPDDVEIISRNGYIPKSEKILYLISTVDNYNVLTDSLLDINTNLVHLMKVLDNCKNKNIEFIFISSWFVYGNTSLPANENSTCNPKGFYSITKYAAELLLESFCKTFDIKYKIIRLGNVIGSGDSKISKKKNALQYLIHELKNNRDIKLYNDGNFYRDIIAVEDVVAGIKFIVENGKSGEIYNLASGTKTSFRDIILYAKDRLSSTSKIGTMEPTDFHKLVQVESMVLDVSKLSELGYIPTKTTFQIIDNLL